MTVNCTPFLTLLPLRRPAYDILCKWDSLTNLERGGAAGESCNRQSNSQRRDEHAGRANTCASCFPTVKVVLRRVRTRLRRFMLRVHVRLRCFLAITPTRRGLHQTCARLDGHKKRVTKTIAELPTTYAPPLPRWSGGLERDYDSEESAQDKMIDDGVGVLNNHIHKMGLWI